jgi:phage/conjugal plasmid C-4 type zinc finger TraR family protein
MNHEDEFEYNNEEEAEMAQIHSLHLNMNAIAKVREQIKTGPSLENCEECGEEIPQARRLAVKGCTMCIYCQELSERNNKLKPKIV